MGDLAPLPAARRGCVAIGGIPEIKYQSAVEQHINNIFKEGKLVRDSVYAKFAYTANDGKVYPQRLSLVLINGMYFTISERLVTFDKENINVYICSK